MTKSKKKNDAELALSHNDLLALFKEARRPLKLDDLLRMAGVSKRWKKGLEMQLEDLKNQGRVLRLRGGAWGLAEQLKMLTGTLEVQRSGVGFVLPEDRKRGDVFVAPHAMADAMHGDRVVVALLPGGRQGKNVEGRIVRILERAHETMTCRVVRKLGGEGYLCRPTDPRLRISLMVTTDVLEEKPGKGELLVVRPEEQVEEGLWSAVALESLGNEEAAGVQERLVKLNNDIPMAFPPSVVQEAAALPAVPSAEDFEGRVDLRHMAFVTIDGATAKDFDDAVYVEEQGDGYRLWVAIADVSHYVRPGSAMDGEAQERANSYYFPQSVEPMFPEALSNGLCSLNPRVPRLAMVAETYFYADGSYGKSKFYTAVIESKARLTYEQVHAALVDKAAEERLVLDPVLPMLEKAEALARLLRAQRTQRGSLDFDLPEAEVTFNVFGEPVDLRRRVRRFSHQIIEEFMIAANEAVARFLTERGEHFLYRSHPDPDGEKLLGLFRTLQRTDMAQHVPETPSPAGLQHILRMAQGTDQEFIVNRLALRTMMQANYTPEHEGHFGLASECYCHFTSPIRRYADLVVHRALKHALKVPGFGPNPTPGQLMQVADHLNARERKAMEAEREILKRLTVLFLRDRIGERYTGIINGVTDFGFWVELEEVMAEGLVRISTVDDDYYGYFPERQELLGERTGRRFRLGQRVKLWLAEVNLSRLEINFTLRDEEAGGKSARQPGKAVDGEGGEEFGAEPQPRKAAGRGRRPDRADAPDDGAARPRGRNTGRNGGAKGEVGSGAASKKAGRTGAKPGARKKSPAGGTGRRKTEK